MTTPLLSPLLMGAMAFGVYLSEYVSSGVFSDARPLEYGLVGGLNFSSSMLLAPRATSPTRRFGVQLLGSLLQGTGYVAASFASATWHLYLSQGLLVGCGIGLLVIPSTAILSQWFSKKRSIANGISSAGSGLGATLLIRDRNRYINPTQLGFDFTLLQQRAHVRYIVLLFSLSDYALEIGLSSHQATDLVGFLNVGTAVGRPVIGIVSDYGSRTKTACALTFLCGVLCFTLWIPAKSFGLAITFSILCGAIFGIFWMTIGPLCVEVAGLRNLQSLLSLSWITVVIPAASAEVIGLRLREIPAPRPYIYVQIFAGLAYIVASGLVRQWHPHRRSRLHLH
ncbi:major facilitator superfamily domain-containing protein [Lasiosphaeria ovina]|uniref:Major facilitator superfamily domain-containing protein n=1 Tax=Lasiosphaeria ovina TaxID=92902 RepID=A0AAE0K0B6_9PEZI|nr:major facilitator superfamily domain-containing protein [Lasiosphaeria ovina]